MGVDAAANMQSAQQELAVAGPDPRGGAEYLFGSAHLGNGLIRVYAGLDRYRDAVPHDPLLAHDRRVGTARDGIDQVHLAIDRGRLVVTRQVREFFASYGFLLQRAFPTHRRQFAEPQGERVNLGEFVEAFLTSESEHWRGAFHRLCGFLDAELGALCGLRGEVSEFSSSGPAGRAIGVDVDPHQGLSDVVLGLGGRLHRVHAGDELDKREDHIAEDPAAAAVATATTTATATATAAASAASHRRRLPAGLRPAPRV